MGVSSVRCHRPQLLLSSVSSQALSRRRHTWQRDCESPMISSADTGANLFGDLPIAFSTCPFTGPSGSRSPTRRRPVTRTSTSSRHMTACCNRTRWRSLAFSEWSSISVRVIDSLPAAVLNSPLSHLRRVDLEIFFSANRSGSSLAQPSSRTPGSYKLRPTNAQDRTTRKTTTSRSQTSPKRLGSTTTTSGGKFRSSWRHGHHDWH